MHRHSLTTRARTIALACALSLLARAADAQGIGTPFCDATPNSTGHPTHIQAHGSTSIGDNELVLVAAPVPDEMGIFFWGPEQFQIPFGNGFLCAFGDFIVRIAPPATAGGNLARRHVDLPTHGLHFPAERYFQYWFRDPLAGGASFNLSNGVAVTFVP